ncbi:MAG: hypothetical protein QN152_13280 [Armatimonadota bacterium]|nr:hypothetical protein [Armatimonadota bacterium]MDR7473424.1 hypothetical protein [Armatimonadota bacterium]MDR7540478.1 hypothetical protein [Armatimonadota bacterium]
MTKGLLLVALVATTLAQVLPSCDGGGGGPKVIGWVEAKYARAADPQYVVVINGIEYAVPDDFFFKVEVGDLVKYEGGVWTIIRRAGSQ